MNKELKEKLYEPFEVSVKPGRGGYKYVKTSLILDRMNELFGSNWATTIVSAEKIGDEVLAKVRVSILDKEGKMLSWQDGYGSAKLFGQVEIGNLYKSAVTKAQKTALRNWGVALHLDEESMVRGDLDTTTSVTNTPPAQGGFVNTTPPPGFQGVETAPSSGAPMGNTPPTPTTPIKNINPPQKSGGFPPAQMTPEVTTTAEVPKKEPGQTLPTMAPPTPNAGPDTGPNAPDVGSGMENAKVTAIQKIVLDQRVKASGKTFKEFATEQFGILSHVINYDFETVDDLLYKDALLIVAN